MEQPAGQGALWERLEALFHRAMEYPEPQRAGMAREWCRGRTDLLTELLEMLASDSSVEKLLASSSPSTQNILSRPQNTLAPGDAPASWLGRVLGSFELERELGRGGMGIVYLGRRVTGGFTQSVAIKLIARQLNSGPALRHFNLERDTLARLEHKNIARLLDAGVTPEGMPYVAMEYIEGRRLDLVFDDSALSLHHKLRLMMQLCEAVAYVHRNLILHRDLKPANVMVTGEGALKLLDFGTLKLLGPAAELSSEMTQAGMRPMTLRYASPEHIRGDAVSTASDVYSLGVMLYRLIANRLPDIPVDPADRAQRNLVEPPSRVRSRDKAAFGLDLETAKDLDAIVLKAMHPAAAERYGSAEALAGDLSHAIERRPVSARHATWSYRTRRFLRRNRLLVTITAGVALILSAGLLLMSWQASIARAQTQLAERGIEEERSLAHLLLFDYFVQLQDIPGSTDAQRKAVTQAIQYLDRLTGTTHNASIELDSVQAYRKMGLLLGSPYEANLGDADTAIATLNKALPIAQHLVALDSRNLAYLQASMGVETALGQVYLGKGDSQQAAAYLLPAAVTARKIADDPKTDARMLVQAAAVFKTLADTYGEHGSAAMRDSTKTVRYLRESGGLYQKALTLSLNCCQRGLIIVESTLGRLLEDVDVEQSIASYKKGFDTIATLSPKDRATTGYLRLIGQLRIHLGVVYLYQNRVSEAEALLIPERERERHAIALDPIDVRARDDLADLDANALDGYDAIHDYRSMLEIAPEYLDNAKALIGLQPKDPARQSLRIDALLTYAKVLKKMHNDRAAAPYISIGLPAITASAQRSDAEPGTLDSAAEALLDLNPEPQQSRSLALDFARRAVHATAKPTSYQLLILGRSECVSGDMEHCKRTAEEVLKLLSLQPQSLRYKLDTAKARSLLNP
jgi:eukaryotic-like serine/threonine-protein kinase